ncbi:uncharacterized protein PgNI_04561 [Pyricularia grisea]|uniref:Proteophosphoglycan 5 n=1 Tax=Pyricularia grisea TaxID=148305 RepID=A0A6P8B969_PYRGI|nr:uncharacterized protein PgNI_04561 [Pyricularia grisea]TLD12374.1 hypothetical protein PgNI_04561 [Pyricularia grisea]
MHQNINANNSHRRQGQGRRRQSRNTTQSPATRKYYASENDVADMPVDPAFQKEMFTSGPQTPRKFSPPSPTTTTTDSSLHPNSQPKQRSGNKNRSKNHPASPGPMKGARKTPPPTAASAKGPSVAAFAGATFHASPAPSSLPIPSFMAKSVPDSPGIVPPGRLFNPEPSPPPTDSERPTPVNKSAVDKLAREESPLDFFFRADKAEKERARRASSANALTDLPIGPFSPPSQPRLPRENGSGPSRAGDSPLQHSRRPHFPMNHEDEYMATDSSNTPVKMMGPAFSTPYQDRIRAARSSEKPIRGSQFNQPRYQQQQQQPQQLQQQQQQQQQHAVDRSEALKQFLFAGTASHAPPVAYPQPATAQAYTTQIPNGSQLHQGQGSTQPVGNITQQSSELLAIEDGLRRILKLDSSLHLGVQPPAFANAHSA